jgi:hypothetical protein
MSGRDSWAVVKESLTTQMRSGHEATVKQTLTVQIEGSRKVQRTAAPREANPILAAHEAVAEESSVTSEGWRASP